MDVSWIGKTFTVFFHFFHQNPYAYLMLGGWLLFSSFYVFKAFTNYRKTNKYLLHAIPFVFTTIGLLGTAMGCLVFVFEFDANDLVLGAKHLLKGILGSSLIALVGIALSMLFSKLIDLTNLKEDNRKALENNELFVLKRQLRLMVSTFRRESELTEREIQAVKDVESAIDDLGPALLERMHALESTMGEGDENVASKLGDVRDQVGQSGAALYSLGEKHAVLMARIIKSLTGEHDNSLKSELAKLRAEQQNLASQVEQGMKVIAEKMEMGVADVAQRMERGTEVMAEGLEKIDTEELAKSINGGLDRLSVKMTAELQTQGKYAAERDARREEFLESMGEQLGEQLVEVIAGDGDESFSSQLKSMRAEQTQRSKALELEAEHLNQQLSTQLAALEEAQTEHGERLGFVMTFFDRDTEENLLLKLENLHSKQDSLYENQDSLAQRQAALDDRQAVMEKNQEHFSQMQGALAGNQTQMLSNQDDMGRELAGMSDRQDAFSQRQEDWERTQESWERKREEVFENLPSTVDNVVQGAMKGGFQGLVSEVVHDAVGEQSAGMVEHFNEFLSGLAAAQARTMVNQLTEVLERTRSEQTEILDGLWAELSRREDDNGQWRDATEGNVSERYSQLMNELAVLRTDGEATAQKIDELGAMTGSVLNGTAELKSLAHEINKLLAREDVLHHAMSELAKVSPRAPHASSTQPTAKPVRANGGAPAAIRPNGGGNGDSTEAMDQYLRIRGPLGRSMDNLLERLKEIEGIKSADAQFWNKVARQMGEGVPIIMGGNRLKLNGEPNLENAFQERLSQSFVNLDKILRTIVEGYERKGGGLAQ